MKFWKRVIMAALAVLFIGSVCTSCNTTRGLGRDVETLGEGIQNTAD